MPDLQFDLLLSECKNSCRFRKVKYEWAKGVAWRRILESKKEEHNIVKKHLKELEKKSKSDIKVFAKEVKSLRSS
jgi:hypothetical protein